MVLLMTATQRHMPGRHLKGLQLLMQTYRSQKRHLKQGCLCKQAPFKKQMMLFQTQNSLQETLQHSNSHRIQAHEQQQMCW